MPCGARSKARDTSLVPTWLTNIKDEKEAADLAQFKTDGSKQ